MGKAAFTFSSPQAFSPVIYSLAYKTAFLHLTHPGLQKPVTPACSQLSTPEACYAPWSIAHANQVSFI